MAVFDGDDFSISPSWRGDDVYVNHFEVDEEHRGDHIGSAVLEAIKRVYYYEDADRLFVQMGGGDVAESFLKANDFNIVEREDTESVFPNGSPVVEGEAIVTAVYEYNQ